jgi:hypothetical protein
MTDVGGLVILFAWIEFAVLAGGMLAVLLRRSGRDRAERDRRGARPARRR